MNIILDESITKSNLIKRKKKHSSMKHSKPISIITSHSSSNPSSSSNDGDNEFSDVNSLKALNSSNNSSPKIKNNKEVKPTTPIIPSKESIIIPRDINWSSEIARVFRNIIGTLVFFFRILLHLSLPLLPVICYGLISLAIVWFSISTIKSLLAGIGFKSWIPHLFNVNHLIKFKELSLNLTKSTSFISNIATQSLPALYCSTIGIGCGSRRKLKKENELSTAAREVKQQAVQALDIFQSVLGIAGVSTEFSDKLDHVALWELSEVVKYCTRIDDSVFLGEQLKVLGDLTRDVTLELMNLNSFALSSFTWILHDFNRLETLLNTSSSLDLSSSAVAFPNTQLEALLSSLFLKISNDLSTLLSILDKAIPASTKASDTGTFLIAGFSLEESRVREVKERKDDWRKWLPVLGSTWEAKQLSQDLATLKFSVPYLKSTRHSLEATKMSLINYSNNVGYFKANLIGYHLAGKGLGLTVEEEMGSLREVMREFRETVKEAKKGGKAGGRKELPASRT